MKKASRHAASRHRVALVGVGVCATVLVGCDDTLRVPPGERLVELERTSRVMLTIQNESGQDVQLVAPGGDKALPAGAAERVGLLVTKIAKLSDMTPGGPAGAMVAPDSAAFYTISSEASQLVEMQGPRGVVRVRAGEQTWTFFLEAGECVFCGEHTPVLRVRGRPRLTDRPLDLCEGF